MHPKTATPAVKDQDVDKNKSGNAAAAERKGKGKGKGKGKDDLGGHCIFWMKPTGCKKGDKCGYKHDPAKKNTRAAAATVDDG